MSRFNSNRNTQQKRIVTVKKIAQKVRNLRSNESLTAMFKTLSHVFTNPEYLIAFAAIFYLAHTTYNDTQSSPVHFVLEKMITDPNSRSFGCFCCKNIAQFFGLLSFLPALFYSPPRKRGLVFFLAVVFIYILPNRTNYTAVIQGFLTFLFVKIRGFKPRALVLVAMLAAYFIQLGIPLSKISLDHLQKICDKKLPQKDQAISEQVVDDTPEGICVKAGDLVFNIVEKYQEGKCRIDYQTKSKWKTYLKTCTIKNGIAHFPNFICLNDFNTHKYLYLDSTFLDYVSSS